MKIPKPKPCRICKEPTTNKYAITYLCSVDCAIAFANRKKDRLERDLRKKELKAVRDSKERLKTRQEWIKEAQTAFNAYIRERDKDEPCISCGRFHAGKYDAGHYRSTKAASHLRYCEDNVWKQCRPCNGPLSGNLLEYRIRLIQKIGFARVESLENDNRIYKWTIEELKEIKSIYRQKLRDLKKG